jgi:flagellar biosynthesis/type III secretory pathway M-ring protein FliF/YscJ
MVIVAVIIAVVVIVVVILLRDRLLELSVNGKEASMQAKMEGKNKAPSENQDEKPVSVVFKGNTLRGEGKYRMRSTDFSENDVDGKQNIELGYDEPPGNVHPEEEQ